MKENTPKLNGCNHSFSINLAKKYGVDEALILSHMIFWINFNRRNNKNYHQGKTWFYQSVEEMSAHFPYWSKDKISNIIDKLSKGYGRNNSNTRMKFEPVIAKGNFNKNKYDRTAWYSFIDEDLWLEKVEKTKNLSDKNSTKNQGSCAVDLPNKNQGSYVVDLPKEDSIDLRNVDIVNAPNEDLKITPPIPESKQESLTNDEVNTKRKQVKEKPKVVASSSVVCDFLILGDKYKKVRLKTTQLEKLKKDLGESRTKFWIQELDLYLESSGKKYKNHEATIFNWAQRQASKQTLQEKYPHIGAHRLNSKLCFEKDYPPSGWKPKHIDVSGFLPDFGSSPPIGA